MEVSRKQIASPPFSPAIPALGIWPRREICSHAPKKSCYRGVNCNMIVSGEKLAIRQTSVLKGMAKHIVIKA